MSSLGHRRDIGQVPSSVSARRPAVSGVDSAAFSMVVISEVERRRMCVLELADGSRGS